MTTLATLEPRTQNPAKTSDLPSPPSALAADATLELSRFPPKAKAADLAKVTAEALGLRPPLWAQSVFGHTRGWFPPHRQGSEFRIIDPRQVRRALRFLSAVNIPSWHKEAPEKIAELFPESMTRLFWRPTRTFDQPGLGGERPPHAGEHWFFINGICTDEAVARMNAELLVRLFHRPLTVIQNATNSWGLDLWECALGKSFRTAPDLADHGTFTEPALVATLEILRALDDPGVERVVVIAHSQGTIIASNVLRAIIKALEVRRQRTQRANRPLSEFGLTRSAFGATQQIAEDVSTRDPLFRRVARELRRFMPTEAEARRRLAKLELYTFACCADKMKQVFHHGDQGLPWIEHFANRHDLVARLGVLAPCRSRPGHGVIDIDGPLYVSEGKPSWGHLLDEHYLFHLLDHRDGRRVDNPYPPTQGAPAQPRLYEYFAGG